MATLAERIESRKRALSRLERSSRHDAGMAEAFPLGAGFGRGRNRGKRLDATIDRAVKASKLRKEISRLECRLTAPVAAAAPTKSKQSVPPDSPAKVRQSLRMNGTHTFACGAVLGFESGWSHLLGDSWGRAVLVAPDGNRIMQDAKSIQGGAMEDAAMKLWKRYQASK